MTVFLAQSQSQEPETPRERRARKAKGKGSNSENDETLQNEWAPHNSYAVLLQFEHFVIIPDLEFLSNISHPTHSCEVSPFHTKERSSVM